MSTKLTSHKLEFLNPVFSRGRIEITVRDGPKWAKRVTPGMVVDVAETNGDEVGEAEIVGVLSIIFDKLPEEILEREHDPACRDYNGLLEEMERVYPSFKPTNRVTVLFFQFVESDSE